MKPPRIDWDFKHLSSNRDEMRPMMQRPIDNDVLLIIHNVTKDELCFVWGDYFGKLVSGGE